MNKMVIKLGCTWQYSEMPSEEEFIQFTDTKDFDDFKLLDISDASFREICIIRKSQKYGIYTFDHASGFGGPQTWCTPTINPFPYDEVKCCVLPDIHDVGFLAFRIGDKWGIIKVVVSQFDDTEGIYDVEYAGTKRRIVVPCQYESLEEATQQLSDQVDFKDPFAL